MAQAPLAKYFAAILTSKVELLPEVLKRLAKHFGPTDIVSEWFPFIYTDFYEPEMGPGLKRCLVSFEKLRPTSELPKTKKWTAKVEDKFRVKGKRVINLDAGYLDFSKLVLVSGKFGGHKIAITDTCFADMIMDYQKGSWHPFQWCFPDFRSGIYSKTLLEMRARLKKAE